MGYTDFVSKEKKKEKSIELPCCRNALLNLPILERGRREEEKTSSMFSSLVRTDRQKKTKRGGEKRE